MIVAVACGIMQAMAKPDLDAMNADELRQVAASLFNAVLEVDERPSSSTRANEIHWKDLKISQLSHEMAILKRWRFGRAAEAFHGLQRNLLEESIDEDLGAIEIELETVRDTPTPKKVPVRTQLPIDLPRVAIRARARLDGLRLWLPDEADRRGRVREAGLRPRDVPGRAPRARQVGL